MQTYQLLTRKTNAMPRQGTIANKIAAQSGMGMR
jgi:hypothetical protein